MILQDVIEDDLDVVIAGMAAGWTSAGLKSHYAHPQNSFYSALFESGMTDRLLLPEEDIKLPQFGVGLTDLIKDQVGCDHQVFSTRQMVDCLLQKIRKREPELLAFNGKKAAKIVLGRRISEYGLQEERVGKTRIWVLPSTSPAGRRWWSMSPWFSLAARVADSGVN